MPDNVYLSNTTQDNYTVGTSEWSDNTIAIDPKYLEYGNDPITRPPIYPTPYMGLYQQPNIKNNKKGDDDMRYLYEVILVNPKNDEFYIDRVIARSETSALMEVYNDSPFKERKNDNVKFDDLKTSCHILMEWKKEKSLKKAIETIKEAVE